MDRLVELNASAYSYYNTALPTFLEICQPLFNFGIKWFGYIKIFPNGSYLCIANNEKFMQKYFSTIMSQGHNPTQQIELTPFSQSHHVQFSSDLSLFDKKKDSLIHLAHTYDIWPLYAIYKNKLSFVEAYCFGMSRSDEHADQFYIKHKSLLEHFSLYFEERGSHLIDAEDTKKLAYFKQQFSFSNLSAENLLNEKIRQFLEETQLSRIPIKGKYTDISLSKRQVECLSYLSSGKTCKEIGRILNLAPRTVEAYFNNAKEKAGFETRTELLTHFVKNAPSLYFNHQINHISQKNKLETFKEGIDGN